jgi:hypothetical protein
MLLAFLKMIITCLYIDVINHYVWYYADGIPWCAKWISTTEQLAGARLWKIEATGT